MNTSISLPNWAVRSYHCSEGAKRPINLQKYLFTGDAPVCRHDDFASHQETSWCHEKDRYVSMYVFVRFAWPFQSKFYKIVIVLSWSATFPNQMSPTSLYFVDSHQKWSNDFDVIPSFQAGARRWPRSTTKTATKMPIRSKFKDWGIEKCTRPKIGHK